MSSWRDAILNDFVPNVSKLTVVADPDCLLTEEKLALELRRRGFDLIEFSDQVEFRYAYESKYRIIWDRGGHTDLVVVLRLQDAELESLPYDLLQTGRKLSFNLGDLFPNMSYPVIEKLHRSLLDALFVAQRKSPPDRMGDNATKDFILRHVFGIAAELVANEVELLRSLLRLHYGKLQIPLLLAERLIQVLNGHDGFNDWPLSEIVPDDGAFFAFLQERWPRFLSNYGSADQVREDTSDYGFQYPGPIDLPFEHQDVKVYIDNLFLEGKLTPVVAPHIKVDSGSWLRSGITTLGVNDDELRIARLFSVIENHVPGVEARHTDWIIFATRWAELSALVHCFHSPSHQSHLREISRKVNATFSHWLSIHYPTLINLPPTNPAMVHHVPRHLARDIEGSCHKRVALIVVDGLSLDQWVTVRKHLETHIQEIVIQESSTFAWIPTLTSVSRQSIFSGKPPMYFSQTIHSTEAESTLWQQFWLSNGLSKHEIVFRRGLGQGNYKDDFSSLNLSDRTKVIGLVIDTVDKIMHGMQLGSRGMHNQIRQWMEQGYLVSTISELLDLGFDVSLTSDHGNTECVGYGRPSEGAIAELRGLRARVYPTHELRSRVATIYTFAREWQPFGLPENYYPLLVSGHEAFGVTAETYVGHGGISIDEVIVPWVKLKKRVQ